MMDVVRCEMCGSDEVTPADEGKFATCEECGHVIYDKWTLEVAREAAREYEEAVEQYWPERVPSYKEWIKMKGEY